ncbi:MAG: hypothetical protein HFH93_11335 [Lachnospiraceae bacterium]|nr:hypothetical protein [Lachnospiraceae bacterium]
MQPYQEEYIANLKKNSELTDPGYRDRQSFEAYLERQLLYKGQREKIVERNMALLRENLFPLLDRLYEADPKELLELREFAATLFDGRTELDIGLFCQIHQALLDRARIQKDRDAMICELYWLGIGYNSLCAKLLGLNLPAADRYTSQMRLYFMEAAAYLKYFHEIENSETKGYILRSRANVSLGQFKSASDKIHLVKYTLRILQDKWYQEKAPELPWSRYIYMTHLQMASSISRSKDNAMTPQDVADVMESVYVVYDQQLAQAKSQGLPAPVKTTFSYDSINYYCGLDSLDGLLLKMERLMDEASMTDYSGEGIYAIVFLPAFYCNFLRDNPEKLPERTDYLDSLYRRASEYVESFPHASESEPLFFALRQLMLVFVETKSSISYGVLLRKLLMRFMPETYIHSRTVGGAAAAFCAILMEEEPDFFDDIDFIREITDPQRKTDAVLDYAMNGGLFHDAGKIGFTNLYARTMRQWFETEYTMAALHTQLGQERLANQPSTKDYAPIALGHHSWYDGSGGYPESYVRLDCPYRQMVDVISLMDWLDNVIYTTHLYTGIKKTFPEAVREAVQLGGKRFSPLLTERLTDKSIVRKLEEALKDSRREAYRQLYEASNNPIPQ